MSMIDDHNPKDCHICSPEDEPLEPGPPALPPRGTVAVPLDGPQVISEEVWASTLKEATERIKGPKDLDDLVGLMSALGFGVIVLG